MQGILANLPPELHKTRRAVFRQAHAHPLYSQLWEMTLDKHVCAMQARGQVEIGRFNKTGAEAAMGVSGGRSVSLAVTTRSRAVSL